MGNYVKQLEVAKKAGQLKDLTPEYRKFEKKGDLIVGAFISKALVSSGLGEAGYNQYVFDTDDGVVKFHMGKAADNEVSEVFTPGMVYAITYQGKESISGGRTVNKFDVVEVGYVEPAALEPAKPE